MQNRSSHLFGGRPLGFVARGAVIAALAVTLGPAAAIAVPVQVATRAQAETVEASADTTEMTGYFDIDGWEIAKTTPLATSGDTLVKIHLKDGFSLDATGTDGKKYHSVPMFGDMEVTIKDGYVVVPAGTKPGAYVFYFSEYDENGESSGVSNFETVFLTTDETVATYDAKSGKLAATDGSSSDDLSNYVKNVTSVKVDGTEYANVTDGFLDEPAAVIVKSDGSIDTDARDADGNKVFAKDGTYTLEITASGYTTPLSFSVTIQDGQQVAPVYRLYNSYDHLRLYTTNKAEYDSLVKLGWNGEEVGWESPTETSGTAVYRLYNQYNGEHLYTTDKAEYDNLTKIGWTGEDVAFYSASKDGDNAKPVTRFYNRYITGFGSTHHYTLDETEAKQMVSDGWQDEGVAFYALSSGDDGE